MAARVGLTTPGHSDQLFSRMQLLACDSEMRCGGWARPARRNFLARFSIGVFRAALGELLRGKRSSALGSLDDGNAKCRRVLMIHYNFPPLGGMGSVGVRVRFAPGTSRTPDGLRVVDRTGGDPPITRIEPPPLRRIKRFWADWQAWSGALTVKRALGRASTNLNGKPPVPLEFGTPARGLRAPGSFTFPMVQIGWYPFAIHSARRPAVRERKPDVPILLRRRPGDRDISWARRLSRETGIPWVAD